MFELDFTTLDNFDATTGAAQASSGGFLSDFWGSTKGFLEEGISIAGDLAGIKADWNAATGSTTHAEQYAPVDDAGLSDFNSQVKNNLATVPTVSAQWISGIPNGAVMLGGAALVIGLLAVVKR